MASTEEDTRAMDLKKEAAVIDNEYQEKKKGEIKAFEAELDECDLADDDYMDCIKEKFGDWTLADFQAAGAVALGRLRNQMMNRGMYVKNHRVSGGNQYRMMVETIAADRRLEWPRSAVITAGQVEPMRTHDPVLQQILGPSLIEPSFLLKPHHDGAGIMLQHQPTMSEEGDTPAQQLARESQPPSQPPQQRQIAQTPYSSQDARNQDAQFDSRLEAESGQQQPLQREVPIRTTPLADASSASFPALLYAKLAAEDEEEASGTAAVDFVETTSCDEDNGDLCTLTASIEDGSDGGGRSTAVRTHKIDKADARIAAIPGAAVRCGYDRPARMADKLLAITKEDEPPDRLGDDRLRILLRKLAAARLISLPQESQVVNISLISSTCHVDKHARRVRRAPGHQAAVLHSTHVAVAC